MTERLKILISAYACSPFKGSEPGVGWGFVAALAQYHDLWVIVEEEKFREDIERYLADNSAFTQSVHFFYIRKQRNRWLRKLWPPSYYWYYQRWQEDAYALALELHREIGFDLAHQLTMVGFREPGYLWKLGIPFVWGPIGGMGVFPWRFLSQVGMYGAIYYLGYNLFNLWQMRFARRPRRAAQIAGSGLIAATPENQRGAQHYWQCSSTLMSEVGLPPTVVCQPLHKKESEPLRIVWSGLHVPRKALNLALRALANLPESIDWNLYILGQGKMTLTWQQLSVKLGIGVRCQFYGWVSREEVLTIMATSHLLLITSLRDLTSTVTVEALASGLPIVCLDHCGFADVVDESCGIKVPVTTPAQVIADLTAAITRLQRDETVRFNLAQGAVMRAQNFCWEKKAAILDRIYRQTLLKSGAVKP